MLQDYWKAGSESETESLILDRIKKTEIRYKENRTPETIAAYKKALKALLGFVQNKQATKD